MQSSVFDYMQHVLGWEGNHFLWVLSRHNLEPSRGFDNLSLIRVIYQIFLLPTGVSGPSFSLNTICVCPPSIKNFGGLFRAPETGRHISSSGHIAGKIFSHRRSAHFRDFLVKVPFMILILTRPSDTNFAIIKSGEFSFSQRPYILLWFYSFIIYYTSLFIYFYLCFSFMKNSSRAVRCAKGMIHNS